jgi:hypothetical protein
MAHAQKPDFVFRPNGQVHLNRQGRQFSWQASCAHQPAGFVLLVQACVKCYHVTLTGYSLHLLVCPSLLQPCVYVCHHISNGLYLTILRSDFILSGVISRSKCIVCQNIFQVYEPCIHNFVLLLNSLVC